MSTNPIGIIGIGKLGLCFALNLEAIGDHVLGIDRDPAYIASLQDRSLRSPEPDVEPLLAKAQNFQATTDLDAFWEKAGQLVFIVVATPSLLEGGYDHSQVDAVLADIVARGTALTPRHLVIMCTTQPGYCDSVAPAVEALGHSLSYNPEFIAQGRIVYDQRHPDQVLIGEGNPDAGAAIEAVYRRLCHNTPSIHRMSRKSAELTKLATNCFITMKISFANAIGALAETVGAEPDKILAAIGADSRIGPKYLGYGFGYGGPCFPRDNRALAAFGASQGMEMLLSTATDTVNRRHLDFQFQQWMARHAPDEEIVFTQVTYKPGTIILEESQQLALAVRLAQAGRRVRIHEHADVVAQVRALHGDLFTYQIDPLR